MDSMASTHPHFFDYGLTWHTEFTRAVSEATESHRKILAVCTRSGCESSRILVETIVPEHGAELCRYFVLLAVNIDAPEEPLRDILRRHGPDEVTPSVLYLNGEGHFLFHTEGIEGSLGLPRQDASHGATADPHSFAGGARVGVGADTARMLAAMPFDQRLAWINEKIRASIGELLEIHNPDSVPLNRTFRDIGLDSLGTVRLTRMLSERIGKRIPETLAFARPTPSALSAYVLETVMRLGKERPVGANDGVTPAVATVKSSARDEPIAIVGMACRLPGGISSPRGLWRALEQGLDLITEVPAERWDIDAWYDADPDMPGRMNTRWGGFIDNIDRIDATFLDLSVAEATNVSAQQRLLLETCWEALEDAGIPADKLEGHSTGVYMGLAWSDYQARLQDLDNLSPYSMLGSAHSVTVGRISYWLGLQGPSIAIDTACSSSLVSIHLACQALRHGDCDLALAGGANVILDPETTVYFSKVRAMSPTGRCRSFSADADGYVRSDGAGVLLLERLSDAKRNGHLIHAVIRASAVNQDGRSNGLTAPNGLAQSAVIRQALQRAAVPASSIHFLECHGTGTPLGDPIELQAAAEVLCEGRSAQSPLLLGSIKTNIGHTEIAAGVAGVIKTVLALENEEMPRSLHFHEPNPQVPWSDLTVKVATSPEPWPRTPNDPRRAGVSAFGFGGTNAHVILEEAPPAERSLASTPARPHELIILSAKTDRALIDAARRLRAHLDDESSQSLGDIAFSLATTRVHHPQRLALVVESRESLATALESIGHGVLAASAVGDHVRTNGEDGVAVRGPRGTAARHGSPARRRVASIPRDTRPSLFRVRQAPSNSVASSHVGRTGYVGRGAPRRDRIHPTCALCLRGRAGGAVGGMGGKARLRCRTQRRRTVGGVRRGCILVGGCRTTRRGPGSPHPRAPRSGNHGRNRRVRE